MEVVTFRPRLIYVYDALCPWCYAFTPVVQALCRHYGDALDHEVLSGGMVRGDQVREIGGEEEAARLRESYRGIESLTGAQFGEAFFQGVARHRRRLDSEPPARGLAAFRMIAPGRSELELAHAVLHENFWEGGDPTSDAFYGRIAQRLRLDPETFLTTMHTEEARDRAVYDFVLARQLGADSFPRLYLQTREDYLHLVSKGYSAFERIRTIIDKIMREQPKAPEMKDQPKAP